MNKAGALQQPGGRAAQSAPVRSSVVPSRPFAPPSKELHHHEPSSSGPAGTCSATATSYGIKSANPQRQLLIHLPTDYRKGVGICLVNRQGLVFAAKRRDDRENTWQMPQGGIDPAEDPVDAALRELKEETGIANAKIVAAMDQWLYYDFSTQVRASMSGAWLRYRGQTQKWFLVQYLGEDDSEIDLSCEGTGHAPEFSDYSWMPLDHLPERVVSFKQQVYREVQQHFAPRIQQLVAKHAHWHEGIC